MIVLLDYKQIDDAVLYKFFHAQSNGLISMPVTLPDLKDSSHKHVLMALVVPNPFKNIETPNGELVPPNERFPWIVYATNKVSVTN